MAARTSSIVTIPSFNGLKLSLSSKPTVVSTSLRSVTTVMAPKLTVKSSMKDFRIMAVATAASIVLAGNALAMEVLLGADDGSLVFVPSEFTVAKGEKIVFKNNAGFPHNVVFDEDEIPSDVDASKISMEETELLNGAGESYVVTLTESGSYSFYCVPHQGAGMVGKVTVK